ncbi:hypothetical protein JKF63_00961 [Porcisia hertigi]|uniref:Cytochrome b5 heme-binding domain-containing protein n=1 Tax=Porcisia hertigi TaxID=2761500 RepID=A0A836HG22_9TRYP|nr:hypothetical protein JKF63_00961 [Porcisia hertigi]
MSWRNLWGFISGAVDNTTHHNVEPNTAKSEPANMRSFTTGDLAPFTGENGVPIYMSVKGIVYDCTSGADFYGPGKSYAVFAGKEVSRCLGKMLISDEEANANWDDLSPEHMQTLDEWAEKFEGKYPVVGRFEPDEDFYTRQKNLTQ